MVFNEAYWAKARQMRLAHVLSERPIDLDDKSSFNGNMTRSITRARLCPSLLLGLRLRHVAAPLCAICVRSYRLLHQRIRASYAFAHVAE